MKTIEISDKLYEYLQSESNIRKISIETYISNMITAVKYANIVLTDLSQKGKGLRDYYLDHRDDIIDFCKYGRKLTYPTIRDQIRALDAHLLNVHTTKELQANIISTYTDKFRNGLSNLFRYMDCIGDQSFNSISIHEWKSILNNDSINNV